MMNILSQRSDAEKKSAENAYRRERENFHDGQANKPTLDAALREYQSYWDIGEWVRHTLVGVPSTNQWFTLKYAWKRMLVWIPLTVLLAFLLIG